MKLQKKNLLPGTLMVQIQQLMGAATMQGLQHCQQFRMYIYLPNQEVFSLNFLYKG